MSLERENVEFTEKEKEGIAIASRDVAREGEDCIWSIIYARVDMMKHLLRAGSNGVIVDNVFYTSTQFRHEIDIVTEVIEQAKTILQFKGRDMMSELDRHAIEGGLGSVFDPESEISKRINGRF